MVTALLNIENCSETVRMEDMVQRRFIALYGIDPVLFYHTLKLCIWWNRYIVLRVSGELRGTLWTDGHFKFKLFLYSDGEEMGSFRMNKRKQKKQCKALGIVITSFWHKREAEINSRFFCICYPNYPHISILHIIKQTNLSKMAQCFHDESWLLFEHQKENLQYLFLLPGGDSRRQCTHTYENRSQTNVDSSWLKVMVTGWPRANSSCSEIWFLYL